MIYLPVLGSVYAYEANIGLKEVQFDIVAVVSAFRIEDMDVNGRVS
jgi:hypothetical protein